METFQARIDSYNKTKRTKQSLARSTSGSAKWPHATSYIATPRTLADAGFYFDPGPENLDNVTCFMCGKQLSDWEPDDDPFELHYLKCSGRCAWASARCGPEAEKRADGQFHFADSSRLPTSRAMEKARLETFSGNIRWPHDAVEGHGANSLQMAQAGFVYTPSHPGDDSVACYYCGTALNGWDEDDNPTEEHAKRVKRSGALCAFLSASKSSRTAPKASARSNNSKPASQTAAASSDDELATSIATAYNSHNNASRSMRSSVNRASMATKTPASGSRRSARGTGSRTTPSEVDDTENGSGSETGKRVSKSKGKRKGTVGSKGKDLMQVVEEEEEPGADGQDDDVAEILPPAKPKRGPGRPPRQKRTESVAETEVEAEPAKMPANKGHGRTRSKTALASDSDVPQPQASSSRRKTAAKAKEAPIAETEDEQVQVAPVVKQSRKKTKKGEDSEQPSDAAGPSRPKGARTRTVSRSKPKSAVLSESDSDVEMLPEAEPPRKVPAKTVAAKGKAGPSKAPPKKAAEDESSHSDDADDAGYATAEPPAKPRDSREGVPRMSSGSGPQHSKAIRKKEPEAGDDSDVEMIDPAPPVPEDVAKQTTWRSPPQSTSSDIGNRPVAVVRKPSRVSSKSKISRSSNATNRSRAEIVEISSDEDTAVVPSKNGRKDVAGGFAVQQSKKVQVETTSLKRPSQMSLVSSSSPPKGPPKGHSKQQSKTFPAGTFRPSAQQGPGSSKSSRGTILQVEVVERPRTSDNGPDSARGAMSSNAAAQGDAADGELAAVINGKHGAAAAQAPSPPVNRVTTPIPSPSASPPPSTSPDRAASADETEGGFPYTPLLSMDPLPQLKMLTEEESMMTVEQWIRREIERESRMLKEDAERQLAAVKEKAAQMRRDIEVL